WWNVEKGTNAGFLYQQNTLRDALGAAVHFDSFHRHAERVVMANIAQTVNVLQAMILTDPDTGTLVLTPTYHVFAMNAAHHDAAALAVHLRDVATRTVDGTELPLVSASASVKGETALVSLSNLDTDTDQAVVLDLRGREVVGHAASVLTGPALDAHNTPDRLDAVPPAAHDGVRPHSRGLEVDLPAHSYVTVGLRLR
ncbi:MAG TPA: alpha-L-arabinofuranosidase C-terminal domain-containing protein, partial [Actinotalea sp.]|nr:alpha-L-arabinofuranosidase C-terminal domain-containing protein [Actinotalea sp.]